MALPKSGWSVTTRTLSRRTGRADSSSSRRQRKECLCLGDDLERLRLGEDKIAGVAAAWYVDELQVQEGILGESHSLRQLHQAEQYQLYTHSAAQERHRIVTFPGRIRQALLYLS